MYLLLYIGIMLPGSSSNSSKIPPKPWWKWASMKSCGSRKGY